MHTYIFELDIIGFTPGSAWGLAAVYSAWVWRSLGAVLSGVVDAEEEAAEAVLLRRLAMGSVGSVRATAAVSGPLLSAETDPPVRRGPKSLREATQSGADTGPIQPVRGGFQARVR